MQSQYLIPELFHFWKYFDPRTTTSNHHGANLESHDARLVFMNFLYDKIE